MEAEVKMVAKMLGGGGGERESVVETETGWS